MPPVFSCQSVKESLLSFLSQSTAVERNDGLCIATLPIPTVDGRLVDVFIENPMGDYFAVHDGGKAVNELILHGVKITDSLKDHFDGLAKNFRISYADESFKIAGKLPDLQTMILSVGMCSGLAMAQLIGNVSAPTEEPIREQFGHALKSWARTKFKVSGDVSLKGRHAQHRFDFVAAPKTGRDAPIAMSVLMPGSNSLGAAERFGFKVTDLESTRYQKWRRVAVESRAEEWSSEAKSILRNCADLVIEIPTARKIDVTLVDQNLRTLVA